MFRCVWTYFFARSVFDAGLLREYGIGFLVEVCGAEWASQLDIAGGEVLYAFATSAWPHFPLPLLHTAFSITLRDFL